jgi:hypothetical protein
MRWWWCPFCTNPTYLVVFLCASSLKQQTADIHVAPHGFTILIPSQLIFALPPYCCVLSWEATNANCVVFCLTRQMLEPEIYSTRGEHANNHTIDEVPNPKNNVTGQLGIIILALISTNLHFCVDQKSINVGNTMPFIQDDVIFHILDMIIILCSV